MLLNTQIMTLNTFLNYVLLSYDNFSFKLRFIKYTFVYVQSTYKNITLNNVNLISLK